MRGLSRLRPSKPKYNTTWDPQPVLAFVARMQTLDLKGLSRKLATLFVLATGQRLQPISLIIVSGIQKSEDGLRIFIPDLLKTSGVRRPQPVLMIPFFENANLCLGRTVEAYLDATRNEEGFFLFLTFKKPHGVATKQTLSRWVKEILHLAGVDTNQFKPSHRLQRRVG
uniref:Tyr recombinase domain-containing protein n=1 Tax=Photinus pyralis TaxID=7054 RepID=A0A1Y1MHV1_PHOPY